MCRFIQCRSPLQRKDIGEIVGKVLQERLLCRAGIPENCCQSELPGEVASFVDELRPGPAGSGLTLARTDRDIVNGDRHPGGRNSADRTTCYREDASTEPFTRPAC
ncbi:hypothetical protein MYVA_4756 [Mycolicibacterium vaccae 95051]|nr:hypothetical protein MYVA_4756 [Mycolicibacterium vaccae 95051]